MDASSGMFEEPRAAQQPAITEGGPPALEVPAPVRLHGACHPLQPNKGWVAAL
jgi:hypothetical protein